MRSQQLPTVREGLPRVPSSQEVCWGETQKLKVSGLSQKLINIIGLR